MPNQINIIGPNELPISFVPNCCIKNIIRIINKTIGTVCISGLKILSPSIADATDIGGVIIPSASNAQPPIIANKYTFLNLRLTRAYSENIPPSPLLSARSVIITYLIVV
jgi:hypothetical protein